MTIDAPKGDDLAANEIGNANFAVLQNEAEGPQRDLAFAALVGTYGEVVYNQAVRIIRDPEVAAGVAQDVWSKVWATPEKYAAGRPGAWLTTVAHNAAVDHARSAKRRPELSYDPLTANSLDFADPDDDPATMSARQAEIEWVRKGLAQIPEEFRETLLLWGHGFSYNEIASKLNISEGTVKSRIHRGQEHLKQALQASETAHPEAA